MLTSWKHNFVSVFLVSSAWKKALGVNLQYSQVKTWPSGIWGQVRSARLTGRIQRFEERGGQEVFRRIERAGPVSPERGQSRIVSETEDYGPSVNGKHKVPFKQMLFTWWCVTPELLKWLHWLMMNQVGRCLICHINATSNTEETH